MSKKEKLKTCCIIGYKKIDATDDIVFAVKSIAEMLIVGEAVKIFAFGSEGDFNDLCRNILLDLKIKYPEIEILGDACHSRALIDTSDFCMFYYDENYLPDDNGSFVELPNVETTLAYLYARHKNKTIFNVFRAGKIDLLFKHD